MRYFITIGSPECPHLGLKPLAKVGSDVEAVAELLNAESQGYSRALAAELPLGAPSGVIKHKLGKWFLGDARTEGDCVVIYVAGHGDCFGQFNAHCLLTSDTEPRDIDTVVKVEELIERIFAAVRYPRNVLLILDVCYAGRGAGEAIAKVGTSLKKAFPSGGGALGRRHGGSEQRGRRRAVCAGVAGADGGQEGGVVVAGRQEVPLPERIRIGGE